MEPSEAFGQVLRKRRRAAELSQEQLALDAGLVRNFISLLEQGHRQPTLQTMLKLATVLGCSAADLVAETEALINGGT